MIEQSDNYSLSFEILFWKVFHNRFLFELIFEVLKTMPIEYSIPSKYYVGNRITFKNICSLKWFVENSQMELLGDKLKSDQYIFIDKGSILDFFKKCNNITIIDQFLKKKENQIKNITNLISVLVESNNHEALQIALSNTNMDQNPITIEIIKNSILFSSPQVLKHLLSKYQEHQLNKPIDLEFQEKLKQDSLYWASQNTAHLDEMLQFI
ncbi:hypothetical protein DICPUDRAFT_27447, partial [Dictyostelium purpureum]